jgi:hypothetical protein
VNGRPDSIGTTLIKLGAVLTGLAFLLPIFLLFVAVGVFILIETGAWQVLPVLCFGFIAWVALSKNKQGTVAPCCPSCRSKITKQYFSQVDQCNKGLCLSCEKSFELSPAAAAAPAVAQEPPRSAGFSRPAGYYGPLCPHCGGAGFAGDGPGDFILCNACGRAFTDE